MIAAFQLGLEVSGGEMDSSRVVDRSNSWPSPTTNVSFYLIDYVLMPPAPRQKTTRLLLLLLFSGIFIDGVRHG